MDYKNQKDSPNLAARDYPCTTMNMDDVMMAGQEKKPAQDQQPPYPTEIIRRQDVTAVINASDPVTIRTSGQRASEGANTGGPTVHQPQQLLPMQQQ